MVDGEPVEKVDGRIAARISREELLGRLSREYRDCEKLPLGERVRLRTAIARVYRQLLHDAEDEVLLEELKKKYPELAKVVG